MGLTYVRAKVSRDLDGPWKTVRVLVDTGAYLSVLPPRILKALGIRPIRKERFRVGDGRVIQRDIGDVCVRYADRATHTQVVFGDPEDVAVLGALTLEELYLQVDPQARRLRKKKGIPLMSAVPAYWAYGGGVPALRAADTASMRSRSFPSASFLRARSSRDCTSTVS